MRGLIVLLLGSFCAPLFASDGIHSYVDENGVRVLTNIGTRRVPVGEPPLPEKPPAPGWQPAWERAEPFLPLIREISGQYSIDEVLVKTIIAVESNFNPNAVSPKNCKGLMQLHPDTARRFGVRDIFDPAENIEGGLRYLNFLMDHFDHDLELVLAAYNAGENAVKRHNGVPPFPETREYLARIGRLYDVASYNGNGLETRQATRIHRIVLDDGRILFTNTPELHLP